jgi:signal transduction histidine kinase
MQIEPAPVSVVEILADVLDTARPLAAQRSVEFRLDVPHDPIVVHVDRERIRQVLVNLVDNALKFTPQDGHIRLGARPSGGEVVLLVEDSGTGIEHAELPRIFERFRHRRRAAGSGTGLGLAICRGIVEAHGGRIWARNRESGGAAFAFTLPACAHAS